mmetsp:Transcript_1604/g.4862  ORF Transcript_1604/g.4862 Transcript_1604/m.4862 type:complete len:706 (-) Transcript_1604:57-2174(-)
MACTIEHCVEDESVIGVKICFQLSEAVPSKDYLDLLIKQDGEDGSYIFCLRQSTGKDHADHEILCRCPYVINEEHVRAKLIRNRSMLRVFAPILTPNEELAAAQECGSKSWKSIGEEEKRHVELDSDARNNALRLKNEGNQAFRAGDFQEAQRLYTESIQIWQEDEFVYTNRALCFLKQGALEDATRDCMECTRKFPNCARAYERLGDIHLSKGDSISAENFFHVALRIQPDHSGCLAGIKQLTSQFQECSISRASSKESRSVPGSLQGAIQYVSECLKAFPIELQTDHERGRCIKSRQDVQEGEVLMEASALAAVVNDKYSGMICSNCFNSVKVEESVVCANECGGVLYCSKRCQVLDSIHHDGECSILSLWNKSTDANQKRGVRGLRLFLRLVYAFSRSNICAGLLNLLEHDKSASKDSNLLGMARVVNRFVDVNFKLQDEVIASMISKAQRNMHGIVDLKGQNFGHGLYPLASFINHSCEPNAIISFDGNKLVVRALENIPRGTEITIAYVELYAPLDVRRDALLSRKGFLCRCSRCRRPIDHPLESRIAAGPKETIVRAQEGWSSALREYQAHQLKSSHFILMQTLHEVGSVLMYDNWIMFDIYKLLVDVCLGLNLHDETVRYCRLVLGAAKNHLHRNHPIHALMEQHYADAMMRSSDPSKQDAIASYDKALRVLQNIYGRHHRETVRLKQKLHELSKCSE